MGNPKKMWAECAIVEIAPDVAFVYDPERSRSYIHNARLNRIYSTSGAWFSTSFEPTRTGTYAVRYTDMRGKVQMFTLHWDAATDGWVAPGRHRVMNNPSTLWFALSEYDYTQIATQIATHVDMHKFIAADIDSSGLVAAHVSAEQIKGDVVVDGRPPVYDAGYRLVIDHVSAPTPGATPLPNPELSDVFSDYMPLIMRRYPEFDMEWRVVMMALEIDVLDDTPYEVAKAAMREEGEGYFVDKAVERAVEQATLHLKAPSGFLFAKLVKTGHPAHLVLVEALPSVVIHTGTTH